MDFQNIGLGGPAVVFWSDSQEPTYKVRDIILLESKKSIGEHFTTKPPWKNFCVSNNIEITSGIFLPAKIMGSQSIIKIQPTSEVIIEDSSSILSSVNLRIAFVQQMNDGLKGVVVENAEPVGSSFVSNFPYHNILAFSFDDYEMID